MTLHVDASHDVGIVAEAHYQLGNLRRQRGDLAGAETALRAAHRLAGRFPDGQLYADLYGASPHTAPVAPIVVLQHFLRSLGLGEADLPGEVDSAAARYRSLVAGRRVLVVLDNAANAEQTASAAEELNKYAKSLANSVDGLMKFIGGVPVEKPVDAKADSQGDVNAILAAAASRKRTNQFQAEEELPMPRPPRRGGSARPDTQCPGRRPRPETARMSTVRSEKPSTAFPTSATASPKYFATMFIVEILS